MKDREFLKWMGIGTLMTFVPALLIIWWISI